RRGAIGDRHLDDLDRIGRMHENVGLDLEAGAGVAAAAEAEAMTHLVRTVARDRTREGRPHATGLLVAQVERFVVGIAHRVVVPWREPQLAAVATPRAARARFA